MSNILLPDRVYYITGSGTEYENWFAIIRTQKTTNTKLKCFLMNKSYHSPPTRSLVSYIPPDYYLNPDTIKFKYSVVDTTDNHLIKLLSINYE